MSTRVADRIEEWNARQFSGGYRGLQQLADQSFSGVLRAGETELFMTRGVAVGIQGGGIEAFDGASGTAHEAPSPALPLLAVMQDESDEVRDRFYTEQTPLSAVDETLSEGGFTGYVELSENVLSGDYYLVYHAGNSMSVAFVGQSGRLVDGQEAFQTANDEVGIYEVRPARVEPIDLPTPESDDQTEATAGAGATGASGHSHREEPADADAADSGDREQVADAPGQGAGDGDATVERVDKTPDESAQRGQDARPDESAGQGQDAGPDEAPGTESASAAATAERDSGDGDVAGADIEVRTVPSIDPERSGGHGASESGNGTGAGESGGGSSPASAAGEQEPEGSEASTTVEAEQNSGRDGQAVTADEVRGESGVDDQSEGGSKSEADDQSEAGPDTEEGDPDTAVGNGETGPDASRAQIEQRLRNLEREHEQLREQLATVRTERDELATALEEQRHGDTDDGGPNTDRARQLTPEAALRETVVFVRYDSRGHTTLQDVHGGEGDRQALRENIQLETYGGFETAVTVEGQSHEAFVAGTTAYRFLRWVTVDLPFEIRETGNETALEGLYDTLPRVDHADFRSAVSAGDDKPVRFDVVLRDRRERPLVVVQLDDSPDPVTGAQIEQLVSAAERTGTANDSLQAAFLLTRSYFGGEALDVADDATQGRLFGRNKRKSLVSLSRNRGFHLCLVEDRDGSPHLAVPEL